MCLQLLQQQQHVTMQQWTSTSVQRARRNSHRSGEAVAVAEAEAVAVAVAVAVARCTKLLTCQHEADAV